MSAFASQQEGNPASNFVAVINRGDGHDSLGTVSGSSGYYTVTGSHNYGRANTYPVGVTIALEHASTVTATASTTAAIAKATLEPACEFLLDYEEDEDEDDPGGGRRRKKPWRYRWPDEFCRFVRLVARRRPPSLPIACSAKSAR